MPTSDVVADLYDGFLRRRSDLGVCEEIARDLRMRAEERQPRQLAARRASQRGPIRALLLPRSRHDAAVALGFWSIVGLMFVLQAAFWPGPIGAAALTVGVALAVAAAWLVGIGGMNLGHPPRPTTCVGCGYDMAGIPAAIDPSLTEGESTGPARCPECGMRWPLVPRGRPE